MATPRPSTSHDVFLEAALAIADEFGPDAVTTRSLGKALDLDATTVYRYFGSKDTLLGSLYDHVAGKALSLMDPEAQSPRERIRAIISAYRSAFFEHPNVARLNGHMADMLRAGNRDAPNTMQLSGLVVLALRDLGLSGEPLVLAYQMIESFTVGAVNLDSGAQSSDMELRLLRYRSFAAGTSEVEKLGNEDVAELSDTAFWRGIDAILDSIEAMLVADMPSE
jgi:AcrR family transcriptional regulator